MADDKVITTSEQTLVDLALGKTPQTADEKKLAEDIQAIKYKGQVVEIPPEFA